MTIYFLLSFKNYVFNREMKLFIFGDVNNFRTSTLNFTFKYRNDNDFFQMKIHVGICNMFLGANKRQVRLSFNVLFKRNRRKK